MNYIIDPMFFYWAEFSRTLKFALMLFWLVPIIIFFIVILAEFSEKSNDIAIKLIEITSIVSIFAFIIGFFIPNKETLIEMKIASVVTKENIDSSIEIIKQIVNFIK